MKRKLTKLELYGVVAVLLAAAFYGYLTQVYDPAEARLAAVNSEISAAQAEIRQQRGVLTGAPAVREKAAGLEAAAAELEAALAEIRKTAKADDDRAVTEAMDLIDELAAGENLTVKELRFGRRIAVLGQEPEAAPARRRGEPEVVPTIRDRLGWQEYRLVFSGNRQEIIAFMGRLAQAVWLVRVNELRVDVVPPPREGGGPALGEYEIALTLVL
ncbi:MAG: hypothetical protein DDT21_02222 [Syntrophomonadaceae bacterium]|nr:hypothetical protein [Bacillota bacterium]